MVFRDDEDSIGLKLIDRTTGARIHPVDLGFLGLPMRPALYQLLAKFSPVPGCRVELPQSLPDSTSSGETPPRITYRPRIVYDSSIVLARRRWVVPSVLFPTRAAVEDELSYFVRLNRWRSANGIPAIVYVRVFPKGNRLVPIPAHNGLQSTVGDEDKPQQTVRNGTVDDGRDDKSSDTENGRQIKAAGTTTRSSRDFVKPQFIDFASPLLADLFGRLPAGLSDYSVQIEERYPPNDALPMIAGERYASELIIQIDSDEYLH